VALISLLIVATIYAIRFVILKVFIGKDILPQLFVAPRGLITVLLFYAIPEEAQVVNFESGILLFVIIATSLIMTWAMIKDKKKMNTLLDEIDEEYAERNEAEDVLRAKQKLANLPDVDILDNESASTNNTKPTDP
jgi:short subunit fatty acids transporter